MSSINIDYVLVSLLKGSGLAYFCSKVLTPYLLFTVVEDYIPYPELSLLIIFLSMIIGFLPWGIIDDKKMIKLLIALGMLMFFTDGDDLQMLKTVGTGITKEKKLECKGYSCTKTGD